MATSNNEWLQIYNDNLTGTSQPTALRWSGHVTDATTVTTTTTYSNVSNQEGRIKHPTNTVRKSRTSRRTPTPTTLLNADITNFRALVQQFTSIDGGTNAYMAAPRSVTPPQTKSSYSANSSGFNYYGMGSRISPPAVGGYNHEVQQQPHQQYYTMTVDNGVAGGDHHQHGFVQRLQDGNGFVNFSREDN